MRTLEKRHAATWLFHSNCAICSDSAGNFTSRYTSNPYRSFIHFLHFIFLLRNMSEIRPSECRHCVSSNQCLLCQFDSASPSCSPGYRAEWSQTHSQMLFRGALSMGKISDGLGFLSSFYVAWGSARIDWPAIQDLKTRIFVKNIVYVVDAFNGRQSDNCCSLNRVKTWSC